MDSCTTNTILREETLEKVPSLPFGLYYTYIKPIPYVAYKVIFQFVDTFQTWHGVVMGFGPNALFTILLGP